VIDADLRKGRVHRSFGLNSDTGLSDAISSVVVSDKEFEKVICKTSIKNLDIIPVGTFPPNPSELLLNKKFELALEIFSQKYEHVIIDSPPILAATDAAIIGNLVDSTLVVVRHDETPLREIEQSVKRLRQAGANLTGVVYNGIKTANNRYGQGKYYYAYS
jgi:tyrosine-protein kinase Etk/Wzc